MSNIIIEDLVLPVVLRILEKQHGIHTPSYAQVKDEQLIQFLHDELTRNFAIRGSADECKDLKSAIEEAIRVNEIEFNKYIKLLLNRYINLRIGATKIKDLKPKQIVEMLTDGKSNGGTAPPDRFSDFRKKNKKNPLDKWGVT